MVAEICTFLLLHWCYLIKPLNLVMKIHVYWDCEKWVLLELKFWHILQYLYSAQIHLWFSLFSLHRFSKAYILPKFSPESHTYLHFYKIVLQKCANFPQNIHLLVKWYLIQFILKTNPFRLSDKMQFIKYSVHQNKTCNFFL